MEPNIWESLCEDTCKSVAVLNTVRCSTGSQCSFFSTGVIMLYLILILIVFL